MSRCNLTIELMEPEADRRPGDTVQGFVTVDVDKAVNCRGLHIILRCRSHGRGNTWKKVVADEVVYVGEWAPGDELVYPFEYTLPNGPVSYHGELLNIIWEVYTYVDIPWGFDPEDQVEFWVIRGEERPSLGPNSALATDHPLGSFQFGGMPGWVAFLFIPMFFLVSVGTMAIFDNPLGSFCLISLFMLGSLALSLVYGILRNFLAMRKLGEVTVDVSPAELTLGDEVSCRVLVQPPAPLAIHGVSACLVCEEVVVSGSGTNRTTHREEILRERVVLAGRQTLDGSEEWKVQVPVPVEAAPSFAAPDNRVEWRLEVHIDIPRWPDFMQAHGLLVAPKVR